MADNGSKEKPRKPKPTKEEIAARKEERKRLKELNKIAKEKQLKKDHLQRELKFTKTSLERGAVDWEHMVCQIKQPQFKEDLAATIAGLEQMLDRKANYVERLKGDRQNAADQFQRCAQGHADFISNSMKLFKVFSKSLKDHYETEIDNILTSFHKDKTFRERIKNRRKSYYENLMHASNLLMTNNISQKKSTFLMEKEDYTNQHIERREKLRDAIVAKMNQIFGQMNEIVQYIRDTSMTKDRLKTYDRLVARENIDMAKFGRVRRDTWKCQQEVEQLQEELTELENTVAEKINALSQEKKYFSQCFQTLKRRYDEDMQKDSRAFRHLVDQINKVTIVLKKHIQHGESILAVTSCCRKLQTEKEKVLPWPTDLEYVKPDLEPFANTLDDLSHLIEMDRFWYKVSLAKGHICAIAEEQQMLERDNANLRYAIRQYCHMQTYTRAIGSLHISPYPTVIIPHQEVAHMPQINPNEKLN